MLLRIVRGIRKHGALGSFRAVRDVLFIIPLRRRRRPIEKPTLRDLVRSTASIEVRAEDVLRRLGHEVSPEHSAEADLLLLELERRTAAAQLRYPERFAVERESGRLLYLLVRALHPELMVETGVANGASTLLILNAMQRNGSGSLVSVDISSAVGSLLTEEERTSSRWDLRVIESGGFEAVIAPLGPMDIFFRDSDHSYANIRMELRAAWPRVAPGGLVLADDAELSFAVIDEAAEHGVVPHGLFDRRKLFMVALV